MNSVSLFVGLDYHQDSVQLCVLDAAGAVRINRSLPSDPQAVLASLPEPQRVRAVAIEACCGAAAFGEQLAAAGNWRVELAHPGYVSRLKQSPDKTDYSDARLLADLTRVGYLPRVWLAPPHIRDLRQLTGHRVRLVQRRRAVKLQIGALLREQRVKLQPSRWSKPWLASLVDCPLLSEQARWVMNDLLEELSHLGGKIAKLEARLRTVTADSDLVAKLRTIEGVGEVTAWMLAAFIGRFDRFASGKQLSRYCGLSPRNVSSGKRQADAGLIDAANPSLRAVLIQAAHRLLRTDQRWGRLGESLLRRGKPKALVVAAVANRWVRSMHHRMLDASPEAGPPRSTQTPGRRGGSR